MRLRPRCRRPIASLLLALLALLACGETAPPVPAATFGVEEGNGQIGAPGEPLAAPIVVFLRDAAGAPLSGARVSFAAHDGGTIAPAEATTDAAGRARAWWTLGAGAAEHAGTARAPDGRTVPLRAVADPVGLPPIDVVHPLAIETYDGSGQVVHPDEVTVPPSWGGGAPRRLAITPYPGGDARWENPSLFAGGWGATWWLEQGAPNPVVLPNAGYLSDPDVVFVPELDELRLYYRQVDDANRILLVRSDDGRRWSSPVELLRGPNHTVISPSVVRRSPTEWLMWTVNGRGGCGASSAAVELRRSADGLRWSAPVEVALEQEGFFPWHIEVRWIPALGEYWALYNVKTAGSCTTPAVFLATSADGIRWTTYPSPVLARDAIPEFAHIVYRSTFAYDPTRDEVTLWYSGARWTGAGWIWRAAVQRRARAALLGSLASSTDLPPTRADVPELEEWP
jgi:hypothetical protein